MESELESGHFASDSTTLGMGGFILDDDIIVLKLIHIFILKILQILPQHIFKERLFEMLKFLSFRQYRVIEIVLHFEYCIFKFFQ